MPYTTEEVGLVLSTLEGAEHKHTCIAVGTAYGKNGPSPVC